jgi:predicted Co/Zn/Cd cation transporter (cation efflux family)
VTRDVSGQATPAAGDAETQDAAEGRRERLALRLSAVASAVIGGVAVAWGLAVQSQALLLDGVYAVIGTALSLLTLHAARLVAAGPTPHYPFGREALAPLMVGVQGLVLLGTLLYASVDALLTIRSGGSQAAVGSALVYAVLSLALAVGLVVLLRRLGTTSELVGAEAAQWRAGAVLSGVLAVGFGMAVVLTRLGVDAVVPYIDPVLVLTATALLISTPLRMVRTSLRELLEAAPDPSVIEPVAQAVDVVRREFGLPEPAMRIGKLGRKLYIELDFVVEQGAWAVGDADVVRRTLVERLAQPGRLLWVNVELHTDPEWDH